MIKNLWVALVFCGLVNVGYAQGAFCADVNGENGADPFCSITGVVFPNCNASNPDCVSSAESGPNYGCLGSQPFPAWYFLRINDAGTLQFVISQSQNEDGTGNQLDVDYICYGPFADPISPCQASLTAGNTIDCSFSGSATETMTIPNAVAGDYYLVLITNFSQQTGFISFQQTTGTGSTDCSILDAALGPDQDICGNDPVTLDGTNDEAIRYEWSVFNEVTSVFDIILGEVSPTLVVTTSGRYQLLVEDANGDTETDEVMVTFHETPTVSSSPLDLNLCEVSNGEANFDFSGNTTLILGGQDALQFQVLYFLNQNDADARENAITELYTTSSTTIYSRIENLDFSNCFEITSFEVIVDPAPNLSSSTYGYSFCEPLDNTPLQGVLTINDILPNLSDSSDNSISLLAADEPLVLSDFNITFHRSNADAISGANPIVDGALVVDQEVLYIRVVNNQNPDATGCVNVDNIAQITVSLFQIPEVNPVVPSIIECASSVENQQIGVFDLTQNETNITLVNNPPSSQVLYFASQEDFDNDIPIATSELTAYENTTNPQTIIAVVENTLGNCDRSNSVSFTISVEALPTLVDNDSFQGERKICVNLDGTVQAVTEIGEDIGAFDGNEYVYDWTPDNVDSDNDGNEDPIFRINQLTATQSYSLTITRLNFSSPGSVCSNAINPVTQESYQILLSPTGAPDQINYEVSGGSFSERQVITAFPVLSFGDTSDLEYGLEELVDGNFQLIQEFQDSPEFQGVPSGDYRIIARNRFGCTPPVVSETIQLLGYPKYFTPNGDGFHDTWSLVNIENQSTIAQIYIFDRYGKLLKQLIPGGAGWDGTYNGRQMPSSEYWFKVEFVEPTDPNMQRKIFKGSFSLIR